MTGNVTVDGWARLRDYNNKAIVADLPWYDPATGASWYHDKLDGVNVLYGDGHVKWYQDKGGQMPFVGWIWVTFVDLYHRYDAN